MSMDEREELKQELERELRIVQYRIKMLDIIEEKLIQMREMAELIKEGNLTIKEIEVLNIKIDSLAEQIKAIDGESKRVEDRKILE